MLSEPRRRARAKYASAAANVARRPDDPIAAVEVRDARRDYYATALEDYIKKVVDLAPPLTPAQRDRLALLLRPGGDAA
jgi:hypothetical protein